MVTIVRPQAKLLNCPRVTNAYVGDGGKVEASELVDVTMLSEPDEVTAVTGGAR